MVSSIQLGNFFSSGGRTVLGGLGGSGLDTQALVDGLVAARGLNVTALQDRVDANTRKSTALSEFKTLMNNLKSASDLLRNVPGFNKASSNAFSYATGSITSNTSIDGESYISMSVEPGTPTQSFTIDQVISVAQAKKQRTDSFVVADGDESVTTAVPGPNEFKVGSFLVNGQLITLEEGDGLNRIASKFNAVSEESGVSASVLKLGDNDFRLIFTATETGTDADFDLTDDPGTISDPDNILGNITFALVQNAANASFMIDNQTITRQGNTVNDAIDGVTFTIQQATPALTTLTANISPDTVAAKNAIIGFINAYNDIKIFQAQQTEITEDGSLAETAVLAGNSTLRSSIGSIGSELSRIVGGLSGTVTRLSDIGVTFTDLGATDETPFTRNVLTLDDTKLTNMLTSDFDKVRKLFEFDLSSANPSLAVFSRTNALAVSEFTIDIDTVGDIYTATYNLGAGPVTVNLDVEAFGSGTGYRFEGQEGTALEGLVLLYSSGADATINVTATQGIGDRLFNFASDFTDAVNGALTVEQDSLASSTDRLNADILRLNDQLDIYRQQLLEQFGRLEQAISSVNTILQGLAANDAARESSS